MLILDPTASSRLILDPTAPSRLILVYVMAGPVGSFQGCLEIAAAVQGGIEVAPAIDATLGMAPSMQSAVELSPSLQASFIVAPSFEGALEIGVMSCSGELSYGDLLLENTTDVRIVGLKVSGSLVNDATCTMTLRNSSGTVIVGADGLSLTYTGTPGEYMGRLPATLDLAENGEYKLKARAEKSGVAIGTWTADLIAKVRGANYCACLAFLLLILFVGCSSNSQPPRPKQVRVTEVVVHAHWIVGHVVECEGRRYLMNTAGGVVELPPRE